MKEEKRLKRKVRSSYALSTVSISLVLFLMGAVGYLIYGLFGVSRTLQNGITATVELSAGVDEEQREQIREQITKFEGVGKVEFLSRDEKIKDPEFQKLMGYDVEAELAGVSEQLIASGTIDSVDMATNSELMALFNPLLDSYEVQLLGSSSDEVKLKEFVEEVSSIEGVEGVYYPTVMAQKVKSTISVIQIVVVTFGLVLLFISLVLLNNTIRLAIFSKRHLINTMKLVGASRWFIMRPLMWSGVKSGLCAGVLASLMFVGSMVAFDSVLPEMGAMRDAMLLGFVVGAIIVSGVIISLIFTMFAATKFVNMKSNKIFLY